MQKFKVNDYITLKLEDGKTIIYLNDERFQQCTYLLLSIPLDEKSFLDEIKSIDEAAERLDHSRHRSNFNPPPETEFWGHCSNLQVWYENNYDTRLLHRNLAFPLLKKLTDLGDPIAKRVFKEEIAIRFECGHPSVVNYLKNEGYLYYLNIEEINTLLETSNLIKFFDDENPWIDFQLLKKLADLGVSEAKKILREEIIKKFDSDDLTLIYDLIMNNFLSYLSKDELNLLFDDPKLKLFKIVLKILENQLEYYTPNFSKEKCFEILDYRSKNFLAFDKVYIEDFGKIILFLINISQTINKRSVVKLIEYLSIKMRETFIIGLWSILIISKNKELNDFSYFLLKIFSKDDIEKIDIIKINGVNFLIHNDSLCINNTEIRDDDIFNIKERTKLRLLYLNHNNIKETKWLENLNNLEILEISDNNITEIDGLSNLKNLKKLRLFKNQISEIKSLDDLENLAELNLACNYITEIKGLNNLKNLLKLNLNDNKISEISGLYNLVNLSELYLAKNKISKIKGLDNLSNLKTLILLQNIIDDIEGLDGLTQLKELNISDNNITEIKGLKKLNLKKLQLSRNKISEFNFSNFPSSLIYWDLRHNPIKKTTGIANQNIKYFILPNTNLKRKLVKKE